MNASGSPNSIPGQMQLHGETLTDGGYVILWAADSARRAVISDEWSEIRAMAQRVMRRLGRLDTFGELPIEQLGTPGAAFAVQVRGHVVGLARARALGDLSEPLHLIIARRHLQLAFPLVTADLDRARWLARKLGERLADVPPWEKYVAELAPADTRKRPLPHDPAARHPSELERHLQEFREQARHPVSDPEPARARLRA